MIRYFDKINKITGTLKLPGDKSISHRAVMLASMADGKSTISNLSNAEDVISTINCFRQLGCNISESENLVVVNGRGFKGFTEPAKPLYAGNSGTTARLISGILAAQSFRTVITGDESLSIRPMKRIIDPLSRMGAELLPTEQGTLPMEILPAADFHSITYELPVASAQVKSAVLLAGLHLHNETTVIETTPSRDHTEKLLNLKVDNVSGKRIITSSRKDYPIPSEYFVPSDISTSAFFMVLALLVKDSHLIISNVSLNESRTGVINILREMGGNIETENIRNTLGEIYGDIVVKGTGKLLNVDIPASIIPNIIDEIPILSIAGAFADGDFRISSAKELRFKETDRIKALCYNFRLAGLNAEETDDGFIISGNPNGSEVTFESFHDHRIAMSFAVFSSIIGSGRIKDFECVNISNPDFLHQIKSIAE